MKKISFAAVLLSTLAAAPAFAYAGGSSYAGDDLSWVPQTSAVTRDQVKAQVAQAAADGTLRANHAYYPEQGPALANTTAATSTVSRAEVKAQIAQAAANHTLRTNNANYPLAAS